MRHSLPIFFAWTALLAGCSCTSDLGADGDGGVDAQRPAPRTDECGNGLDDDADGRIDDGCPCAPGESQRCFSGAMSSDSVGVCEGGTQTCESLPGREWGDWGESACEGEVLPADEACDGTVDDDCDGAVDEGCPCTDDRVIPCGLELVVEPCHGGEQTCRGGVWSACEGAVFPSADLCDDGIDNDCDGTADELCACVPEPEVCRNGIDDDCDGAVDEPACTPDWPGDAGAPPDGSTPLPTCDALGDATGSDWTITASPVADGSAPGSRVEAMRVAIDGAGNVFVLGRVCDGTSSVAGFAVSSYADVDYAALTCNVWLVALDPSGALRYGWNPVLADESPPPPMSGGVFSWGAGLAPDGAGGVWIAGGFSGVLTLAEGRTFVESSARGAGRDALLVHLDAGGVVRETIVVGEDGTGEQFEDVIVVGGEPVVLGRSTAPLFAFGSTLVRASGGVFVARVASDGEPRWVTIAKRTSATGDLTPGRLAIDPHGDVVLAGGSAGEADFGGTPSASRGTELGQSWLWTIDAAGGTTTALRSWDATVGYYAHAQRARLFPGFFGIAGDYLRGSIDLDGVTVTAGTGRNEDPRSPFVAAFGATMAAPVWARALAPVPYDAFHGIDAHFDWNACHETLLVAEGGQGSSGGAPIPPVTQYDFGGGLVSVPENAIQLVQWSPEGDLDFRREVPVASGASTDVSDAAWSPVERVVVVALSHGTGFITTLTIRRIAFR